MSKAVLSTPGFASLATSLGVKPLEMPEGDDMLTELLTFLFKRFESIVGQTVAAHRPGHIVDFGFSASMAFNAKATCRPSDLIWLNAGTVVLLHALFERVAGHPDLLTWVGDPATDEPNRSKLGKVSLKELGSNPHLLLFSADSTRRGMAIVLKVKACQFLFAHELGHVWNGHTDLLLSSASILSEIEDTRRDVTLSPLDRQTLEMDADAYGTTSVMSTPAPFLPKQERFESKYGDGATDWFASGLAIYLTFRMFDHASSLDDVGGRTHPPAPVRAAMCLGSMIEILSLAHRSAPETSTSLVGEILLEGEAIMQAIFGTKLSREEIAAPFSEEGVAYTGLLIDHWATLRPRLDQLKRGGNLAAVQGRD
jgi:hypothetical protein